MVKVRELSGSEVEALHIELLVREIMRTAEKLPPFPDIAWKVMMQVRSGAPDKEVANVIRHDKKITAKIVSLAQSSTCNRRFRVSSLDDAVSALAGYKLIQATMAACACSYFECNIWGVAVKNRALWKHSVTTAVMAERIARHLNHSKLLTIYTAGLLHDISKTVLDFYAEIYLHTTLDSIRARDTAILKAEREALGIDHQELGEFIARRWRLPPEIIMAIAYHHNPHKASANKDITSIVHAADCFAKSMNGSGESHGKCKAGEGSIAQKIGLNDRWARTLASEVAEEVEAVETSLMNAE